MSDTVAGFFSTLEERIDKTKIAGMKATFQFNVTGDGGGQWYVSIVDGSPAVGQGVSESPNITITTGSADWLSIVNGKMSGQSAFLTGRLQIRGDMGLAMKLTSILT